MEKKVHKMIPANMRPDLKIRESNQLFWHFELTRIKINPADQKHPIVQKWVQVFRDCDYDLYWSPKVPEVRKIQFLAAMNVDGAELAHDPTLPPYKELKEAKREALNNAARARLLVGSEAEYHEGKRSATIADVKKLLDKKKP